MGNIKFNYDKVAKTTENIKQRADTNLKQYAEKEYKKIKVAMENCKGDYNKSIVEELDIEKQTVLAAVNFIVKLQNMMQKTADAFQETDSSYQRGMETFDKGR